jgi:hypothetical protein
MRGPNSGHKKSPSRSLINAHGMLTPGDYTTMPMRSITTYDNTYDTHGFTRKGKLPCRQLNSGPIPSHRMSNEYVIEFGHCMVPKNAIVPLSMFFLISAIALLERKL